MFSDTILVISGFTYPQFVIMCLSLGITIAFRFTVRNALWLDWQSSINSWYQDHATPHVSAFWILHCKNSDPWNPGLVFCRWPIAGATAMALRQGNRAAAWSWWIIHIWSSSLHVDIYWQYFCWLLYFAFILLNLVNMMIIWFVHRENNNHTGGPMAFCHRPGPRLEVWSTNVERHPYQMNPNDALMITGTATKTTEFAGSLSISPWCTVGLEKMQVMVTADHVCPHLPEWFLTITDRTVCICDLHACPIWK